MQKQIVRYQLLITGRVQAVGFRYTAVCHARQLGLSGWVKNNGDRSVTMEVQGSERLILELLRRLRDSGPIRIDDILWSPMQLLSDDGEFREKA